MICTLGVEILLCYYSRTVMPSVVKRLQSIFNKKIVAFGICLEFESSSILGLQYSTDLFAMVKMEGPWFQNTRKGCWLLVKFMFFLSELQLRD